jgi:diguanylate cyclase (GGDEF)-like protein
MVEQTGTEVPEAPSTTDRGARGPARWPHAWWVFLAAGALVIGVYQLIPAGLVLDLTYVGTGLLAVLAILVGTWLHRPPRSGAWIALAVSQALWVLGDLVGAVQAAVAPTDAFPTVADVFYLAGYPPLALSLFVLTRGRRPPRDVEGALDSLTVAAGLYLLCWVLLARPTFARSQDSWMSAVVGAAYPLLDISIIAMLVALVITPGTRTTALRLLAAAVGLVMTADTAATALGLLALDSTGPIDFLWMLSYVVIGAAALHPSMYTLSEATTRAGAVRFSRRRRVATAAAVLVAPGTLAVEHAFDLRLDLWAVVLASVVMFLLVVARMNVVIQQIVAANGNRDRAQRELAHQAAHDSLTGLPNRAQALQLIAGSLSRAQRTGAMVGLLYVDLDGFKSVNDTYGHQQGDVVLREVAKILRASSREIDEPARYGGEELAVVLPGTDLEGAYNLAERVRIGIETLDLPLLDGMGSLGVTASFGVATLPGSADDMRGLFAAADDALYRAKRAGKNRTERAEGSPRLPGG